jgi:hypothetical protein
MRRTMPRRPDRGVPAAIAKQLKRSRSSVYRVMEGHRGARLRLIASKNRARMRPPLWNNQRLPRLRESRDIARKITCLTMEQPGLWLRGGQAVPSDFTVFHAHLAEACRDRKKTPDPLCAAAVDLHFAGVRALDVYRLAKLADELDVSVDWLLGRSDMMELPKAKSPP